jgi:hypothetical protein
MEIKDILKPEEMCDLKQFSIAEQEWLNNRIKNRKDGKLGVECIVRGKTQMAIILNLNRKKLSVNYMRIS